MAPPRARPYMSTSQFKYTRMPLEAFARADLSFRVSLPAPVEDWCRSCGGKIMNVASMAGVACLSLTAGLVLFLVAFSSPYWLERTPMPHDASSMHFGLWLTCREKPGDNTSEWQCGPTEDMMHDGWGDDWVRGMQGIMTVALISLLPAWAFSCLYVFVPKLDKWHPLTYVSMCLSFTTAACSLTCFIVFGARQHNDRSLQDTRLSWSFAVSVASFFFVLIAFLCLLAESVMLTKGEVLAKQRQWHRGTGTRVLTPALRTTAT